MRGISTGAYEAERDAWRPAVARARREAWPSIELCAIRPPLLEALGVYLADGGLEELATFTRISIHAPVGVESPDDAIGDILRLPLDADVILHPDLYGAADAVTELGERAVFENMDVAKDFGRTADDMQGVFDRFAAAGFCLDVAHVWTNDPSLALGHSLLDRFSDRLRQLHVSGIEQDGTHRETTPADLELYAPLLERCPEVAQVLESTLAT